MKELDETLVALAEPTRRQVVELLRERPCRAGELATRTRCSAPAMSRHLRVLRRCGIIEEARIEEDYRVRTYQLRPERFDELNAWVEHMRGFWTDQLTAFKDYVQKTSTPVEPE